MARHSTVVVIAICVSVGWISSSLARDQFFVSDGVRIRYVEKGEGEPLVLIHGNTSRIETTWVETGVFDFLADDFHVIGIDLRGFGQSDKPHEPSAYGANWGEDVVRLLDHLAIQRAHIVGYSLGARITTWLVVNHPGRVASASLGASTYYVDTPKNRANFLASANRWETGQGLTPEGFQNGNPGLTEEEAFAFVSQRLAANDAKAVAAAARGAVGITVTEGAVSAIDVPVLHVIGTRETQGRLEAGERLRDILPSLESVVVEGATHAGSTGLVGRAEFVAAITDFVARHPIEMR